MKPLIAITTFFAAAIFLAVAIVDSTDDVEPQDPTAAHRAACRHFIDRTLHAPRSAEWIDYLDWSINDLGDGSIVVGAEYRAKNSLGALVREVTFCDITLADGDYRLEGFRQ